MASSFRMSQLRRPMNSGPQNNTTMRRRPSRPLQPPARLAVCNDMWETYPTMRSTAPWGSKDEQEVFGILHRFAEPSDNAGGQGAHQHDAKEHDLPLVQQGRA